MTEENFKELVETKINNENRFKKFVDQMTDSQVNLSLICFIGAGTSAAQGYANWNGYIEKLINFWEGHLQVLTNKPETFYTQVEATDIAALDWLKNQNFDNKRKVDIVDFIIKKYCSISNGSFSEKLYQEHVNDFEQFYFLQMSPLYAENEILNRLVKLSGLFITTNYDDQIETTIDKKFTIKSDVIPDAKSIPLFTPTAKPKLLPDKSVIHLHGTPGQNGVLLVSSSKSYNELYYDNPQFRENLLYQINHKRLPLILFVGSSLQEEEILHYLKNDNGTQLRKFALMKYDFSDGRAGEYEAKLICDYYEQEKGIKIIWYGKNYNDLPRFLDILNDEINQNRKDRNKIITAADLKNALINNSKEDFNKLFSKSINNQEIFLIDPLFENDINLLELDQILENKDFINSFVSGKDYPHFWKYIKDNLDLLDKKQRSVIVWLIQNNTKTSTSSSNSILGIIHKLTYRLPQKNRLNTYLQWAGRYLKDCIYPEKLPNLERCAWLIANFTKQYSNSVIEYAIKRSETKFKLSAQSLDLLLSAIKDIYYGTNYQLLIDSPSDRRVSILQFLIENDDLQYVRNRFPSRFYENKLIQKIMINLALKNKLPDAHFKMLLKYFDVNDQFMGKETNGFVAKFMPELDKGIYYGDGVYSVDVPEVKDTSFFQIIPLDSEQEVKNLTHKLLAVLHQKENEEHNIAGQKEKLLEFFINKNNWLNKEKYNVELIQKIIENKALFTNYVDIVNSIIIFAIQNNYLAKNEGSFLNKYFSAAKINPNFIFKLENDELVTYFIKNGSTNELNKLCTFLFKEIEIKKLEFYSEAIEEGKKTDRWINYNNFVNTPIFNYYLFVQKIFSGYPDLYKKWIATFVANLNTLKIKEREYSKGLFYPFIYEKYKQDKDLKSENCFIGYTHFYQYMPLDDTKEFKQAVVQLLNSNFSDEYCLNNIAIEMKYAVSPEIANISVDSMNKKYLISLIKYLINTLYFKSKLSRSNYCLEWAQWMINNYLIYVDLLFSICVNNIENDKVKPLFKIIENAQLITRSINLPYIYFKDKKKYNYELLSEMISFIEIFNKEGALNITSSVIVSIESYLRGFLKLKYTDLSKRLLKVTKTFLPKEIQEDFEEKYL